MAVSGVSMAKNRAGFAEIGDKKTVLSAVNSGYLLIVAAVIMEPSECPIKTGFLIW